MVILPFVRSRLAYMIVVALLAGCGTKHGTVPVGGTVTLDGQSLPGPGKIMFTQIEPGPGQPVRPGFARFTADGAYEAQTFEPGDGLFPGKYGIAVECWETPPNMDGLPVKSFIPAKFSNPMTSGFELTVEVGSKRVEFDIPLTSES